MTFDEKLKARAEREGAPIPKGFDSRMDALLDTLPALEEAVRLYRRLDFSEVPCYNDSPVESTLFFQLDL